jgi:stage II sporulation protein D
MTRRAILLFSLAVIFLAACQPPRSPIVRKKLPIAGKTIPKAVIEAQRKVLIGLRVEVNEASVSSDGPLQIINMSRGSEEMWPHGRYSLLVRDGNVLVEGKPFGTKVKFVSADPECLLQSNGQTYRGAFIVKAAEDSKITLINELGIDDYLKGVLPREVVISWPQQSLRVQAVASRTYLASHLGHHASQGFDLCSDVHCQVYGGTAKEHPKTSEAVDATNGEILVYNGKPMGAFFHSNCGGSTEEIAYVWGQTNVPYLPRKKCGYGTADPRYHWKLSLNDSDILAALKNKTKVKGNTLKSLRVKKKSPSGRAQFVTVTTDQGAFDLSGNEFRIALNPEKIRSTLWTRLDRHKNAYSFEGRGWGHGIGMCQWGAKGQAEQGRDYREILNFYYPHTSLVLWSR